MSLTEVLVATMVMGLMITSLAMATRVIIQQADNTEGRSNNARSEQNVGLYMPADLSSAETVNVQAAAVPCGPTPACPPGVDLGGSNALMLTWSGQDFDVETNSIVSTVTNVSYRVIQVGQEFRLVRTECDGFVGEELTCTSRTVLRNLDSPPPDVEWFPGTTRPTWIISVTQASAADAVDGPITTQPVTSDAGFTNKNAQRVVVTINGGGDVAGAGGGQNQISLSAGGTNRQTNLSTDDLAGAPTFTAARSRCGGNFGLIVDRSGSIGTDMPAVRNGIKQFIDAFAGTPVKLQVVTFSTSATTLGSGSGWTKYYDMLIDTDVTALKTLVDGVAASGGTNWEDGFFRMLKNSDGTVQSQLPNTILFFTDGIPTFSRLDGTTASVAATASSLDAGLPASDGSNFSQIGWNRAERVLRDRGSINVIGVYVNSNTTATSQWVTRSGYHIDYFRGNNVVFQQGANVYERANNVVFQVSTDSDLVFERRVGSTWSSVSRATFLAGNLNNTESDNFRTRTTGSISSNNNNWVTMTEAQYYAANSSNATSDGFRTSLSGSSSTPWVAVTLDRYNGSNTTTDSADGWRTSISGWNTVSEATYNANNTVAAATDGWRTTTSGSASSWTSVSKSVFDLSNTIGDDTDGWRSVQSFEPPYDFFVDTVNAPLRNYATIGNIVVGNTSGVEGGFVEALPRGGPYTNAAAADLFVLPNYTNFGTALASVALGQCGGTVTMQTRVGSTAAQDPFTYENTTTNAIVQTSAAYRSGTFDIALPGGAATTVTISPQQFTNLVRYQPAGWSCRSGGTAYPFTTVPVAGYAPWTAIRLTVNPNQAVSCIQQVVLT
ncbi:MAG: hypothetical protein NTZ21_12780 [Actinobacteria bacterium]|nr:hypothetical protein [Actinomycetota bacterium]